MRLGEQEQPAQVAEWGVYVCMGRERSHLVFFMSQKIIPHIAWTSRIWTFLLGYPHFIQPLTQNTHSHSQRSNEENIFQVAKYSSICRYSSEIWSATSSIERNTQPTHLLSPLCRKRKSIRKSISDISKVHQKPKSYPSKQWQVKFPKHCLTPGKHFM